jgi:hypothetical protein
LVDLFYIKKDKMFDDEINSSCSSEQSVYEQFMQWLKERFWKWDDWKSFRDRLWDNLDDMLDDPVDKE